MLVVVFLLLQALVSGGCITVRLGATLSLTGRFFNSGIAMNRAIQLYSELINQKINSTGTLPAVLLDVSVLDDRSELSGVRDGVSQHYNSGIQHFVGPFTTEMTDAMIQQLNFLFSGQPNYTALAPYCGGNNVLNNSQTAFGIAQSASSWLDGPISVLSALGARRVLVVAQDYAATQETCAFNFSDYAMQRIQPAFRISTDLSPHVPIPEILDTWAREAPDVVVFCTRLAVMRDVLTAAKTSGISAHAYITTGQLHTVNASTDAIILQANAMDMVPWAPRRFPVDAAVSSVELSCSRWSFLGCISPERFSLLFEERWGERPPAEAAAAFAALEIYEQLMTSLGGEGPLLPVILARAMGRRWFDTVYGRVTFGVRSRMNIAGSFTRQMLQGKLQTVLPVASSSAVFEYPTMPWLKSECISSNACGSNGACTESGACQCKSGFGGDHCEMAYGMPLFVVVILLGTGCVIAFAVLLQRKRSKKRAKAEVMALEARRDAMDAAARQEHYRLLGYATHEIANPLFAITAITEEAVTAHKSASAQITIPYDDMLALHTSAQHIRRVLHEMAAHRAGRLSGLAEEKSTVNVRHVMRDVMHRLARTHDIHLHLSMSSAVKATMSIDPLMLYELLFHLCLHMSSHCSETTTAHLRVRIHQVRDDAAPHREEDVLLPTNSTARDYTVHASTSHVSLGIVPEEGDHLTSGGAGSSSSHGHSAPDLHKAEAAEAAQWTEWLLIYCSAESTNNLQSPHGRDTVVSSRSTDTSGSHSSRAHVISDFAKTSALTNSEQLVCQLKGTMEHRCQDTGARSCQVKLPVVVTRESIADEKSDQSSGEELATANPYVGTSTPLTLRPPPIKAKKSGNNGPAADLDEQPRWSPRFGSAASDDCEFDTDDIVSPVAIANRERRSLSDPPRVLVIEDDPTNLRIVARLVNKHGWKSQLLSDGADLPEVLSRHPRLGAFRCILLDIVMPRSNGVTVARQIREAGYRGLLVAMTANTHPDDVVKYKEAGFDQVLGKPFNFSDLRQTLDMACELVPAGARGSTRELRIALKPQR